MARKVGKIVEAGYTLVPGTGEKNRRYIAPDGREVSYRHAFNAVRGESVEEATVKRGGSGVFREDYRLAKQTREAARRGDLVRLNLATEAEERELATISLKKMIKGTPTLKAATRHGEKGLRKVALKPTLYHKIVTERLRSDVRIERKEGETRAEFEYRLYDARRSRKGRAIVGPKSDKARLLVALGRRKPESERFVGES